MICKVINWKIYMYTKNKIQFWVVLNIRGKVFGEKGIFSLPKMFPWIQDWWLCQGGKWSHSQPSHNEWGHSFRPKPQLTDSPSLRAARAASPSYFTSVKMKCLLAWKEELDLKQNKKSQLPDTQNDCVHYFSMKSEVSGYHGLFSQQLVVVLSKCH